MKLHIAILFLAASVLASCSHTTTPHSPNDSTNNNNGGGVPATINTMVVTVTGETHTMMTTATNTTASGTTTIGVTGYEARTETGTGITITNISDTGTYDVGTTIVTGSTVSGIVLTYAYRDGASNSYLYSSPTSGTTSAGTLTVTAISPTTLQGTFNGTLTRETGNGPATIVLTNGGMNVTFQ